MRIEFLVFYFTIFKFDESVCCFFTAVFTLTTYHIILNKNVKNIFVSYSTNEVL